MATTALSSNSLRNIMRQVRQHEAATGMPMSKTMLDSLLRQELEVSASRASQNRALEINQEQLDLQKKNQQEQIDLAREQVANQASAARTSGYVDLASTALTAGVLLKDTETGKSVGSAIGNTYDSAVEGISNIFSPSQASTGAVLGGQAGSGAGGIGTGAARGASLGVAAGNSIGQTGAVAGGSSGASAGTSLGQTTATATGASAASSAGTSAASTAGSLSMSTATGALAGASVGRWLGGQSGDSTAEDIGTIGGAALVGTAIAPGIGTVIGAAVGVVYDVVGDAVGTIICTELYRKGLLPLDILMLDHEYRKLYIDDEVYFGYIKLATPIVNKMKESKTFTRIVSPIARAWAYEMASRVDNKIKGNLLGKLLNIIGQPLCRMAWKRSICHG